MADQSADHKMEDVETSTGPDKGKGKAPQPDTMEDSADDSSSEESGAEDQVCFHPFKPHWHLFPLT